MKVIRITVRSKEGTLEDILEFEGAIEKGQVFRKGSGTCTRLFSRVLKNLLARKSILTIEIKEYE